MKNVSLRLNLVYILGSIMIGPGFLMVAMGIPQNFGDPQGGEYSVEGVVDIVAKTDDYHRAFFSSMPVAVLGVLIGLYFIIILASKLIQNNKKHVGLELVTRLICTIFMSLGYLLMSYLSYYWFWQISIR
jgi:hypothetical protein